MVSVDVRPEVISSRADSSCGIWDAGSVETVSWHALTIDSALETDESIEVVSTGFESRPETLTAPSESMAPSSCSVDMPSTTGEIASLTRVLAVDASVRAVDTSVPSTGSFPAIVQSGESSSLTISPMLALSSDVVVFAPSTSPLEISWESVTYCVRASRDWV